ncbi:MAG: hypothetical protein CMN54_14960 [SAR324 cluster bacterium]|uniref:Short-chain dehydrogenase n=1 Tax=SAR324 cluster bacterium TaxID=2024889 RepID=A0A2D6YND0_9DELT|nr:hypothetical protein [SAR324 cluster bacterium]
MILFSRQLAVLEKVRHDSMQVSKKPIELISMDLSCQQSSNELFQRSEDCALDLEYLENNAGFGNFGNCPEFTSWKN